MSEQIIREVTDQVGRLLTPDEVKFCLALRAEGIQKTINIAAAVKNRVGWNDKGRK